MPCYYPRNGYRSKVVNPSGKRSIVFNPKQGFPDMPVDVPCGRCIGCRLERSRQWAMRCVHEASLYENNCFITLTYDNQNLPKDGSLHVEHFQKFMKRLRKRFAQSIRFFHCGEYGEKLGRPHYHAILFNVDFKDKKKWKIVNGYTYYISELLAELWPFGWSTLGEANFETAAYVARYVTKKQYGPTAIDHYNTIDYETGLILQERRPEYVTMSRRPGIGKAWMEKYATDVFPDDFVVLRGIKMKPPKYYSNQFELASPEEFERIKAARKKLANQNKWNNSPERLIVREEIQKERFKRLKRSFEND